MNSETRNKLYVKGRKNKTIIEANNASTPYALSGINVILHNGKKYHSGTICSGVTSELAGI